MVEVDLLGGLGACSHSFENSTSVRLHLEVALDIGVGTGGGGGGWVCYSTPTFLKAAR